MKGWREQVDKSRSVPVIRYVSAVFYHSAPWKIKKKQNNSGLFSGSFVRAIIREGGACGVRGGWCGWAVWTTRIKRVEVCLVVHELRHFDVSSLSYDC